MKKKILAGVLFTLAAVLLFYIFSFSAQDADTSSDLSEQVTRWLMGILNPGYMKNASRAEAESVLAFLNLPVRKLAHFGEYALLGILLLGGFLCLRLSMGVRLLLSFLLCAVSACADEYHQTFVNGRAGLWSDVAIDFSGSTLGILLLLGAALAVLYLMGASRLHRASRPGKKSKNRTYRSAPSPAGRRSEF